MCYSSASCIFFFSLHFWWPFIVIVVVCLSQHPDEPKVAVRSTACVSIILFLYHLQLWYILNLIRENTLYTNVGHLKNDKISGGHRSILHAHVRKLLCYEFGVYIIIWTSFVISRSTNTCTFFLMQWVVCDIITLACPGHRCFQQRLVSRSEVLALLSVCSKRSIVSILRQRGLLSGCVYQHDDLTLCDA